MSARQGWTLTELLVVIAIIALLVGIALPSLGYARERARLVVCSMQMHSAHEGVVSYAAANKQQLPPFAFSDMMSPSLPLSGHWGGISQLNDPVVFGAFDRDESFSVNLWALDDAGHADGAGLVCPSAEGLDGGEASYFPYSTKFSTYCLRFPYSRDVFRTAPGLADYSGLLGVYLMASGGERSQVGNAYQTVPQIRLNWRYRTAEEALCERGDGVYDVAADAMFSDAFWQQDYRIAPGEETYEVRRAWCHGDEFNVAYGDGSVATLSDDGTVAGNSLSSGVGEMVDANYHAAAVERVWQFFDAARRP